MISIPGLVLRASDVITFVSTSNPPEARAFYETTLGLTLVEQSQFALVFDANGTMLRVTIVDRVDAAPYTVLGWAVTDIEAAVRELTGRGVEFLRYDGMEQDAHGIWRAPGGGRIAWFKDPEGNLLSLTQF